MFCEKLSQLFQKVPNLFKIADKLFYSEPFIEKSSTFELKAFLTSYSIAVGVFFNKRVRKNVRIFFWTYHIGCSIVHTASCAFYLWDLTSYDFGAVTLGLAAIPHTTTKFVYLLFVSRICSVVDQLIEFFVNDEAQPNHPVDLECDIRVTSKVKKWITTVLSIPSYFLVVNGIIFHPRSQFKENRFTSRPFLTKYFPMWCPSDSFWAFTLVSVMQDAIAIPALCIYSFGALSIFLVLIMIRDKFEVLCDKLRSSSSHTFEKIEKLENEMKSLVEISSGRIPRNKVKILDQERIHTVTRFYEDFLPCVERFQQLKRMELLCRKLIAYCCTITYCFLLTTMVPFGFVGVEALSGHKLDFNLIARMLSLFSLCGFFWYLYCLAGNDFSEQNDLFANEVYSMPWYYFSPKQRKTVLTFLGVIQKPTYLRALKVIRVKLDAFPGFLNSVYSYIQIMRTLQTIKSRKA